MKVNRIIAKVIATIANLMADKAAGAASVWGFHQAKEPTRK